MKRLSFLVLLIALSGCAHNATMGHPAKVDEFINGCLFDGANNNDITRQVLADTIDTRLARMSGNSLEILSGIPMTFEMMMEYPKPIFDFQTNPNTGKYVVKFSFAKNFDACRASLQVLTILDKEFASGLVDGKQYIVQGVFDGIANEFPLPSGKVFTDKTRVSDVNGMPYIIVATMVVSNPTISIYEEINQRQDN